MSENLRSNALINDALGSALRSGGQAIGNVPALLKRVLAEDSWREFVTKRDEHVRHDQFADFVTTPPLKGLGADMALIERIVGTEDPDLLRLLRKAKQVGRGHRTDRAQTSMEFPSKLKKNTTDYQADRLAREAPEEYEAVRRGEKTVHAAAVGAGTRKRQISVRLDNAESAARTLRTHMKPDVLAELARILTEQEN